MHPLLAKALELGTLADGFTDPGGARVGVVERAGVLRAEVVGPEGDHAGTAWRCPSAPEAPDDFPADVPFLPGLSCVAVREGGRLTVTWPAPPSVTGVPGVGLFGGGVLGGGAAEPEDPVGRAWRRFSSEGAAGPGPDALEEGLDALVRRSEKEGWRSVSAERLEGPFQARVVRMTAQDGERSLTLSRALGVTSLVLLQRTGDVSP